MGAIRAGIREQVRLALRAMKDGSPIDFDGSILYGAMENVVRDVYPMAYEEAFEYFSGAGKAVPAWLEEFIITYLQVQAAAAVQVINDTTRRMILDEMVDGLNNGRDLADIAASMEKRWLAEAPEDGPVTLDRTLKIARTEIGAAQSAASFVGARDAGMTHKRWHSARDERTRGPGRPNDSPYDHYGYHDTLLPINQPFVINGEQMMFPRDRSLGASPGNFINCRCAMTYEYRENLYV